MVEKKLILGQVTAPLASSKEEEVPPEIQKEIMKKMVELKEPTQKEGEKGQEEPK
jgi:hypothetical protein